MKRTTAILLGFACVWCTDGYAQPKNKKQDLDDIVKSAEALLDDPAPASAAAAAAGGTAAGGPPPDAPLAPTDAPLAPTDAPLAPTDAPTPPEPAAAVAAPAPEPVTAPVQETAKAPTPPKQSLQRVSSKKRNARIASGANVQPKGPENSPLADLGVPPAAVPAVAAAATAAAMGFWPFLMKTLLALLKGLGKAFIADRLKTRAKKDKKVDAEMKSWQLAGFKIRPRELMHLGAGSVVYGCALYYTLFGFSLKTDALARQETLVVFLYIIRMALRAGFEYATGIITQFRLWIGGSVLCLGAAFLGNPLNTVGYELNNATTDEQKARLYKLTVGSILVGIALTAVFFALNQVAPTKFFQAGLLAFSAGSLSDILPVDPMSGKKVWSQSKLHWFALALVIFPMFFLFNFVL